MIYEIKFEHGEQNLFAESELVLAPQVDVIIRSEKGLNYGRVFRSFAEDTNIETEIKIAREASIEDFRLIENLKKQSQEAKVLIREAVIANDLDMKIIEVAFNLDKTQLFISFTADNRVDFRALLRELASIFRTRIELRQIGTRDASKIYGGIGPCGRPLCCSEFIYEFPNVSIKMAKNQTLSLKQSKLNGLCGRLMCCLTYEDDFYREAQQRFPDFGQWLEMEEGRGRVIGLNILGNKVKLRFEDYSKEFDISEIEESDDR
ncbi:regulatory iron-sulfur-containing complex subunit RicT [Lactococcus nasutitermitis]|uniref:Regulatory iron-sulfur-containing complex subunit RicT n=1 Tax=Lactococcus nasutitermitis TaxID=1652957 RepID=A0ABV9JBM4_9LACT|nr:regulatory iron-sulfur-containing complex subunit RicT [Lactococcus nasutitermitis]